MIQEETRRRLKEHGWLEIARNHSNPHLALNRWRDEAIEAINDLSLFAQKLPIDTLDDIFNYANVRRLVDSMLKENDSSNDNVDAVRRIQLAALLVDIGIEVCVRQYQLKIEQNSVLNEPISSQLRKAQDICRVISFKMSLPQIESAAGKNLDYLFNWSEIRDVYGDSVNGEDTWNFFHFCYDELLGDPEHPDFPIDRVGEITRMYDYEYGEKIQFDFSNIYLKDHIRGDLLLDREKKLAYFRIKESGQMVLKRTLVIEIKDDNVYVFKKKKR